MKDEKSCDVCVTTPLAFQDDDDDKKPDMLYIAAVLAVVGVMAITLYMRK